MPPVPQGFPHRLSDTDLGGAIDELAAVPANWPEPVLPELTLMLMMAGVMEQTRRELATASQITKLALGVAALSLAVAIIALFAS